MNSINSHGLARLTEDILSADGSPLLIRLPARRLVSRLLLFLCVGTLLLTLSFTLLAIVTISVLVFWFYLYYLYCHIWRRFRLSRFYTVAVPVLSLLAAVGLRYGMFRRGW